MVPAESVVRVPTGATDAEAASLPMNGLTVRLVLDVLDLTPGPSRSPERLARWAAMPSNWPGQTVCA